MAVLWIALPLGVADILLAPRYHAPHHACDTLTIPILTALFGAPFWTLLSAGVSALLCIPTGWSRRGGTDILDLSLGRPPRKWVVNALAGPILILLVHDIGAFALQAGHAVQVTVDCGGKAEPVTVTLRHPLLQTYPLYEALFGVWVLHLRALALSPRRTAQP